MAEAAVDTVNPIAFGKFEEISDKICDLADKDLEIGEDLVAKFLAELKKLEGEDVEDTEDLKETIMEHLESLLEELKQQRATGTTPESREDFEVSSRLSFCLPPSVSLRSAFRHLRKLIFDTSAVRNSQRTGIEFKRTTTSPNGTTETIEVFAGITHTFAPETPESHANNSESVKEE